VPGFGKRAMTDDAPRKANFLAEVPDVSHGSEPMSRAEQDACFLAERWPEPAEEISATGSGFARFRSPTRL
jgi:hypothetical protein